MPASLADTPTAALSRIRRRLAAVPRTGWSPPPLAELIAGIDRALAEGRR